MNANQYYYYDILNKPLRYLIAKALLKKSLTIEEIYEEIDCYDPRLFDFSMDNLEANGLNLEKYLKENFIVKNDLVSLSDKQKEVLLELPSLIKKAKDYQISRDIKGIKKILDLVKEQKVDSTIPFILFEAFIYEQSNTIDESSLSSMGSVFLYKLYKEEAVSKISEVKFKALKYSNYPIALMKGLSLDFSNYHVNSKQELELTYMKDLLNYRSEYIYLLIYPELEYNLRTLIDLTKDLDSIVSSRIDRFMDRYISSNFYEEYRERYYKDSYDFDSVTYEMKEDYYYFMKNALYSWLKDKQDYLIYSYIKQKLTILGLKEGVLPVKKLANLLNDDLLFFKVMTYIITTDYLIHYDEVRDDIYYDIHHYDEIFNNLDY